MKTLLITSFTALISLNGFAQCFTQISAGGNSTLAIKSDGTLWGWGINNYGQLGDGTLINKKSPIQIGTETNWKNVSCGGTHSLAIKTDGTLWAWGLSSFGQLGDNIPSTKSPIQIGTEKNWKVISAGFEYSLAIKTDGTLWNWGKILIYTTYDSQAYTSIISPTKVGTDSDWISVSAGDDHYVGLKADHSIRVWGGNRYGQLGNGTIILGKLVPTAITSGNNIEKIAASKTHTLAIKTDGSLWAWGDNQFGQLGDGTTTSRSVPTIIGSDFDWVDISSTNTHSIALKNNGTLWVWGSNSFGQLGDGTKTNRLIPTQVGTATNWKSIAAGGNFVIARNTSNIFFINVSAWGQNSDGQLGDGTTIDKLRPTQIISCNILVQSLEDENLKKNTLTITPNPASDFITINNTNRSKTDKYSIVDALGQVVLEETNPSERINIQQLKSGLYFILIESENETLKSKFLKQ